MDESRRWTLLATVTCATVAGGGTFAWELLGTYLGSAETLRDGVTTADVAVLSPVKLFTMAGTGAIAGALVGGPSWAVLVEYWTRSSVTRRGTIAGAVAAALVIPVWLGLFSTVQRSGEVVQVDALLVVSLLALLVGGWATVPIGAVVGYLLARLRRGDATPG